MNKVINPRRFHQRVLLSLLLNQEDAKPSNFIVHEDEDKLLELICVDNDHSFFRAIAEEEGRLVPLVKDISFCFAMMQEKIDPVVAAEILHFDVYALLSLWLNQVEKISKATEKLFSMTEMEKFFPKNGQVRLQQEFIKQINSQHTINETILPITFSEHTLANLYVKLTRLKCYLKEHPEATLLDLLSCAEPYLAKYYHNLILTFPNIIERFQNGFSQLYGEKLEKSGAHQTKKTTFATLQTLHGKPQDAITILNAKNSSLEMAYRELELIHQRQQDWESIYNNIMKGSPQGCSDFAALSDIRLCEMIFNQIDFQKLSFTQEQLLLNTLKQTTMAFRVLKLINCNIKDDILNKLLLDSPELEILVIDNCPSITERIVFNIAKNCPILETLKLSRLSFKAIDTHSLPIPSVFIPKGGRSIVVFAELRALDVSDCNDLSKLYIAAPKLLALKANNCVQLKSGKCDSSELRSLELSHCTSLTASALKEFVVSFPYLKTVFLDGCDKIEHREYYKKFPYLLSINLDLLSHNYLQKLTELLEKFHNLASNKKQIDQLLNILSNYFDSIENKVPDLIKKLSNASPYVQQEAAFYIKGMGRNSPEIIDPLKQLLSSKSTATSVIAAIALLYLDKNQVQDLKILEEVFILNNRNLFNAAIPLLNEFGSEAETLDACLKTLNNGTSEQQEMILYAFAHWTTYSTNLRDNLKQFILGNNPGPKQSWALYAYWRLVIKHTEFNPGLDWLPAKTLQQLLVLMVKFDPATALTIRKKTKNLVTKTSQEIEIITWQIASISKHQNEPVNVWNNKRIRIIQEIGEAQLQDIKIKECLLKVLQNESYHIVRIAIIDAFHCMQLKADDIEGSLINALNDKSHEVVNSAIHALPTQSLGQEAVRRKLIDLASKDEHPHIRVSALVALEKINEYYPDILEVSIKCLDDLVDNIKAA
ncbi:MAG: hypothetical protein H0T84_08675, partial [Tatlockia sp.]|nr:hypothetical protein [Tatlockia sp.]